jgi:hypothetical protein
MPRAGAGGGGGGRAGLDTDLPAKGGGSGCLGAVSKVSFPLPGLGGGGGAGVAVAALDDARARPGSDEAALSFANLPAVEGGGGTRNRAAGGDGVLCGSGRPPLLGGGGAGGAPRRAAELAEGSIFPPAGGALGGGGGGALERKAMRCSSIFCSAIQDCTKSLFSSSWSSVMPSSASSLRSLGSMPSAKDDGRVGCCWGASAKGEDMTGDAPYGSCTGLECFEPKMLPNRL